MRKQSSLRTLLILTLCMSMITSMYVSDARAEIVDEHIVYDDRIGEHFVDYSWADVSYGANAFVHSGTASIRMTPGSDDALYLYSSQYFLTNQFNTLEFFINGGSVGGQELNVILQAGGKEVARLDLDDYLPEGELLPDTWQQVRIYLPPLKMPNGVYDGILLWDASGTNQPDVYVDDIRLVKETSPLPNKPPKPVVQDIQIYDDELKDVFLGFTQGDQDWQSTDYTVTASTYSIRVNPSPNQFLYIYKERTLDTSEYIKLDFWLHGGSVGGQDLKLVFKSGGVDVYTLDLNDYVGDNGVPNDWTQVSIPLEHLDIPNGLMDGIVFLGNSNEAQASVYLDDMKFVRKTFEQPKLQGIDFAGDSLMMYAGNFETPVLTAYYDNGYTETVTESVYWTSSAPEIVRAEAGTIEALAKGDSQVTATYEGFSATLDVKAIEVVAEDVFADGLAEMWDDWSWAQRNLNEQSIKHSGGIGFQFLPRWWQGVYFNREESYSAEDYYGFEFWVNGGAAGGQKLRFVVQDMNTILGSVVLDDVMPEGIKANEWQKVTVRLADMDITEGFFNAIVFQAWDFDPQQPVYVDDVKVLRYKDRVESPKPPVTNVEVTIDANANRRAINPDIYGVNFEEIPPQDVSTFDKYTVMRWGGNSVTRYNWQTNVQNHASDWFYMNLPKETTPGETLPHGSRSDQFIDESLENGAKVLLQVPTIGWTPKDGERHVGFSVAKYGPQQQTECSYGGWWCNPDAGNGIRLDGTPITNNDPHDTSKEIGPEFVTDWINHIESRVGDQVNYYALDNEPMLWPYTHRDVHPQMTTSTEIWEMTKEYGQAIKDADDNAKIFGPVVWGWCAYLYSAADGCAPGADYEMQGNKPFLDWYLEQVRDYELETGTRLIDYLDIHYYPMEAGVAISEDESKAVSARRLKALKSLYDPTFRDSSSWIWEPVNLIPRMKEMIERTAPGTKLAITEYNFGNGRGISSGLAQAEALAIFGREGVDLATRWGQPLRNTPVEDAFKLYLDYDGQGSQIRGDSVQALSSNVDMVGSYAIHGTDGKLYILLFNKDTAPKQTTVAINGVTATEGDVYRFDATNRLGLIDTIEIGDSLSIELPARSATLVVAQP